LKIHAIGIEWIASNLKRSNIYAEQFEWNGTVVLIAASQKFNTAPT